MKLHSTRTAFLRRRRHNPLPTFVNRTAKNMPPLQSQTTKKTAIPNLTAAQKRAYTAKVEALFAMGDNQACGVRHTSESLFPLSMPRWFFRGKLEIRLAAEAKGPLHGAFVDELINRVALEYIIRWDEEEKDKWPPEKEEDKKKKKERLTIIESMSYNAEELLNSTPEDTAEESTEYEPDEDDYSWSESS